MADGILFNNIPGSGLVSPIMTFEVNSGGQHDNVNRFIIIGCKTAAGTLPANTPVPVADQDTVDALSGPGSMLREMFRIVAQNGTADSIPIWLVAAVDAGIAPVWTLTVGALPGIGVGTYVICGETISIPVTATDTPATIAFYLAAAISSYYNPQTKAMLPVTATATGAVVTITGRHAAAIMNEVDFFIPTNISGNIFAATGVLTIAQTVQGAGVPNLAAALNALGDDPADFIVSPWSDSTSLGAYGTLTNDVSGRWAWSQQTYGHVWTAASANFAGLTTLGLGLNDRHTSIMPRITGGPNGVPHPSWLWAAGMAARVAPWLSDCNTGNVSRNQTGLTVQGLLPPRDRSVWPKYPARNTLNKSGISTWQVGADGSVQINKIVTTYRVGASGQPDSVFRNVQRCYQVSGSLKFLRTILANEHGNKGLAETNPGSLGALSTPADVKGTFLHGYSTLCDNGVLTGLDTYAKLLQVKIDGENPDRVNIYNPMQTVSQLDLLAANATIYQKFPQAA